MVCSLHAGLRQRECPIVHSITATAHKEATGCSGKRDRTAFVGRAAFDERTFLSDYRFLEEVGGRCGLGLCVPRLCGSRMVCGCVA